MRVLKFSSILAGCTNVSNVFTSVRMDTSLGVDRGVRKDYATGKVEAGKENDMQEIDRTVVHSI